MAKLIKPEYKGWTFENEAEEVVAAQLARLPDDCTIFAGSVIPRGQHEEPARPDFIVVSPTLGVFVIEVKGWLSRSIRRADNKQVFLSDGHVHQRPEAQAKTNKYAVQRALDAAFEGEGLSIYDHGRPNKLRFPVEYLAILPRAVRTQIPIREPDRYFPPDRVVDAARFREVWVEGPGGAALVAELQSMGKNVPGFSRLVLEDLDRIVRALEGASESASSEEETAAPQSGTEGVRALIAWYQRGARHLIAEFDQAKVEQLDRQVERVENALLRADAPLSFCFLGNSGVGKSTLINAIVAGSGAVLPSGGVGSLTALAMRVKFGRTPSFKVWYQPRNFLASLVRKLEWDLAREGEGRTDGGAQGQTASGETPEPSEVDKAWKQAGLMLLGRSGQADRRYLVDGLRQALGRQRRGDSGPAADDLRRIERLAVALRASDEERPHIPATSWSERDLRKEIETHASGHLAPLVREMVVQWNSPVLEKGVVLVDLPGVGAALDVFKDETVRWVRSEARAIVLVVDRSGVGEEAASLLRESGFLNRLLYSDDDPDSDPLALVVAAVKLDEVAEEEWRNDEARSRTKAECFRDVQQRMESEVRRWVRELAERWGGSGGSAPSEAQRRAIDRLDVRTFPMSAVQYRMLLRSDEQDRPFLSRSEETGIPAFSSALAEIAGAARLLAQKKAEQAGNRLMVDVVLALRNRLDATGQGSTRLKDGAEIAKELESALAADRARLDEARRRYREHLSHGVPKKIDWLMEAARENARQSFRGYLEQRFGRGEHWKTLQSVVRKGGRHRGVNGAYDLPGEFALRYEVPIAEAWSGQILSGFRDETRRFAKVALDAVHSAMRVVSSNFALEDSRVLADVRSEVVRDVEQIDSLGAELIDELRRRVKDEILPVLEAEIERGCQAFVERGLAEGAGVKSRVLGLLPELADAAASAVVGPGAMLLKGSFRRACEQADSELKSLENPLGRAVTLLVHVLRQVGRGEDPEVARHRQLVQGVIASCPQIRGAGDPGHPLPQAGPG